MSKTKDGIMSCIQNNRSQLDWHKPRPVAPDALDHAIQKWMEVTGNDGSTARYKISLLVAKELDWMSHREDMPQTCAWCGQIFPKSICKPEWNKDKYIFFCSEECHKYHDLQQKMSQ